MTSEDDEYIDYSCSTPIERLSRDIETVLRSWHVVSGADRHISLRRQESSTAPNTFENQSNVHLLRSARVCYTPFVAKRATAETISSHGHQERLTVDLELNLYDGPIQETMSPNNLQEYSSYIPFSLISHRNYFDHSQRDILSNLSSLFRIGQHITLCPVPSTTNSHFFQSTLQSIAKIQNTRRNHMIHRKNRTSIPTSVSSLMQASDFFKKTNRISLEERVTLHTATIQSLSNILQTALNFATSSCDCRIPTFGIWGTYRPQDSLIDTHHKMIFPIKDTTNEASFSSSMEEHTCPIGNKDYSKQVIHPHCFNSNIDGIPSWINPENLYNIATWGCSQDGNAILSLDEMDTDVDFDTTNESDDSRSVSSIDTELGNEYLESKRKTKSNVFRHRSNPFVRRIDNHRGIKRDRKQPRKQHILFAPIFCGYCYPGPSHNAACASFTTHIIPPGVSYSTHFSNLNSLGKILLQQSSQTYTNGSHSNTYGKVVVSFARHHFTWNQHLDSTSIKNKYTSYYYDIDKLDVYTHGAAWRRALCPDFRHAHSRVLSHQQIQLIERVTRIFYHAYYACRRSSRVEPLWGPNDDPLVSLNVSVTWNEATMSPPPSSFENENRRNYLLTLPLRIRSYQSLTSHDMRGMENTILSSVFNPITAPPCSFVVSTKFSKDCAYGTLSANIRCILAAMIRTCSLEPDTLLGHLTKPQILKTFQEQKSLQDRLHNLMDKAQVSPLTRNLVEALDWDYSEIDYYDWRLLAVDLLDHSNFQIKMPMKEILNDENLSLPFHRLYKTCCPGSLLSAIGTCVGSLQKPSMMSTLWLEIVEELRLRWTKRETITSIIPSHYSMNNFYNPRPDYSITKRHSFDQGRDGSAFLYSSEAEPDCNDCLLAQKLQVFNIGVEIMIARDEEEHRLKKIERLRDAQEIKQSHLKYSLNGGKDWCNDSETATATAGNRTRDGIKKHTFDSSLSTTSMGNSTQSMLKGHCLETIDIGMEDEEEDNSVDQSDSLSEHSPYSDSGEIKKFTSTPSVHSNRSSSKNEFYDARTCIESATVDKHSENSSDIVSTCSYTEDATMDGSSIVETTTSVVNRLSRHGARCPVYGINLIASSDALFAPYLQRPPPITDEVTCQRRYLLEKNIDGSDETALNTALEIIHRLQKPKLLSDASAFKAANPGAIFQDFANWCGNPENPIAEFIGDDVVPPLLHPKGPNGNASMAALILTATRTFWSDVWDEAEACPATDQRPLFDPTTTVETLLSSLETLHPSLLLNQILSVNLSVACYLLESSAFFCNFTSMKTVLDKLLFKVHDALLKLNHDMTMGISSPISKGETRNENAFLISCETIAACETVCDIIGETEVLLSQAISLSSKFDGDSRVLEDLVFKRMFCVEDKDERRDLLNTIQIQRELDHFGRNGTETHNDIPRTSVREYTLRKIDHQYPCEMSVRLEDSQSERENNSQGGLVISFKKMP